MSLYLNCVKAKDQVTWNKADYLLAAAARLGIDVGLWQGQLVNPEFVLNIEPFHGISLKERKWTGIWEIDVMFDRPEYEN
jgi:hypothetical protein